MSDPATLEDVRSRIAELQELMGLCQNARDDIAEQADQGLDVADEYRKLYLNEDAALVGALDVLDLIEQVDGTELSATERDELGVLRERMLTWEIFGDLEVQ